MKFQEIIDDGVKTISRFGNDAMMPHFLYCANIPVFANLEELILVALRKYGIRSAILTTLSLERYELITKEKSKAAYAGKLKNYWWNENGSITEDLESFLNNLHIQEKIETEAVLSFFLPKLMQNELKLVKEKDLDYMRTFFVRRDVDPEEMKKSKSKDKYIHAHCFRLTKLLNVDSNNSAKRKTSTV